MARVVEIIGVTHNPVLPGIFLDQMDAEPAIRQAYDNFALMRQKLARARPDVLIVVAGDHLNQWFMDNMPAFVVGKAATARGPFPQELRAHKLSKYQVPVDVELARTLLRRASPAAWTSATPTSSASTTPSRCRSRSSDPRWTCPSYRVWTNVMAPPIPPAQRFYNVGLAIRSIVDGLPLGPAGGDHRQRPHGQQRRRPGHAAHPHRSRARVRPDDEGAAHRRRCRAVIQRGKLGQALGAGNGTAGFLDFVLLLGAARGAPPSYVDAQLHAHDYRVVLPDLGRARRGGTL